MVFGAGGLGSVARSIFLRVTALDRTARGLRSAKQRINRFANVNQQTARRIAQTGLGRTLDKQGMKARQSAQGLSVANNAMTNFLFSTKRVDKQTGRLSNQFTGFNMRLLSVMFAGMALTGVMGGLFSSMMKFTGVGSALGIAIKTVLLPIFMMLLPVILKITNALLNMSRPMKIIIGVAAVVAGVIGVVLLVVGQLWLALMGIIPLLWMMGTSLTVVIGVIGAVIGIISAIIIMIENWGEAWGLLANLALIAIAALLAPIIGVPAAIAAVLAATVVLFVQFWDEIKSGFRSAWNFVLSKLETVWKGIKQIGKGFVDFWSNIFEGDIRGAIEGLEKTFKGFVNFLAGLILPDWVLKLINAGIDKLSSVLGYADAQNVGDFILTDDGKVLNTDPRDTIMGFKGKPPGGGGKVQIDINEPELNNDVDISKLVDEVERKIERNTKGRSII